MGARQYVLVIVLSGLIFLPLSAIKYQWGGFVRLDTAFDTRQTIGSDDGATTLFPAPIDYDSNCCDINAHSHFCMTPAVTRLFFKTYDARVKNCELQSYIEVDFTGANDLTSGVLKLRHAYFQALWPKTTLLVGQYYHPIIVEECFTDTVGFNGGMPMASYARWPQIRLEHQWHEMVLGITMYSQFLFQSPGPLGYDRSYMRHSLTPGLCLSAEWRHQDTFAGLLFNVKRLQPAIYTTPKYDLTTKYVTEERITSVLGSAWLGFKVGDVRINNQFVLGQNGPDFNNLGGYAVHCYDPVTGHCTYTNIDYYSFWTDWEYMKYTSLTPGLFVGITKSLGSRNCVYLDPATQEPTFYGFDKNLDQVLRIAPRITTLFHNVYIGFEFDYSAAWFGPMNCKGKHPHTCSVDSARCLLVAQYNF